MVFVGPRTDLWSAGAPQEWRTRIWEELYEGVCHEYPVDAVVLTKRPQEITGADMNWFTRLKHLWVGVSVTGPEDMHRWTWLGEAVPLGRRVLSIEPLLYCGDNLLWTAVRPDWTMIGPRTPVTGSLPGGDVTPQEVVRGFVKDGLKLFVKPAAEKAWPGVPMVQEWPEEMYFKGGGQDGK